MAEFTVAQLVESGLRAGVAPCEIRRKLQSIGVRWSYGWSVQVKDDETGVPRRKAFPGGSKERARRMARLPYRDRETSHCQEQVPDGDGADGLETCNGFIPEDAAIRMCSDCLARKWQV